MAKSHYEFRHVILSVYLSLCLSTYLSLRMNNSTPIGRILIKLDIYVFRKSVETFQVSWKSDKNNEYFTWWRFHIYINISLNSS
jgi:hypothetical protein